MGIEDKDFVVYVAAYLYSLTDDLEGRNKELHIQHFIEIYNQYINSEHDGDCTNKPYRCWLCFIEKYIDIANEVINNDKFNLYLEELKE